LAWQVKLCIQGLKVLKEHTGNYATCFDIEKLILENLPTSLSKSSEFPEDGDAYSLWIAGLRLGAPGTDRSLNSHTLDSGLTGA
jgi:hypothetical protein